MPFCTACGRQNPDDARFCSQCGTRIAAPAPSSPAPAPAAPAGPAGPAAPAGSETGEVRRVEATDTMTFRSPPAAEQADDRPLNDEDAAAVDALPPGSALLVVQRGPDAGSRFLLDTDVVTAGRHPDSEIFLDDVTVSRRHAEFRRSPEGFRVSDVGSLNGTYVNRDRIDDVVLSGGDEVQIGKYRLVFFAGPTPAGR
ncbi:FHA domain-containing protein [Nocardioides sp. HDW12B]|uniref:FHA domain-containing protein n=1 Tax=Nocardioides sp. HDW12B TaxID=2714939 RepID=UPI00140E7E2E|nr:FHA domain-containing protein [Nocardioides sp. HDW12B]QIK66480.1 FHA domain-containing protein [Nocardioides sp. HDW12B]